MGRFLSLEDDDFVVFLPSNLVKQPLLAASGQSLQDIKSILKTSL